MGDFHNPYDCKWQKTICGLPLPWEEEPVESQNLPVEDNDDDERTISIILQPEESDVWWKLTRRSSCDSNTSSTTCESQQIEIIIQPGFLDDHTTTSTSPAATASDVFWKLTRRWSYDTNTTSATNDYNRQVTISEQHNCVFEVPSRSELLEDSAGISLFLTSDELQQSRNEADAELRLSLSCSDADLSYYSAMNLVYHRPSSVAPPLSSSSSNFMYNYGQAPKRRIFLLCIDASIVRRKMTLFSLIRDHRTTMSNDVLCLRHSGEYDLTEYENNIEPMDVIILDESVCSFPTIEAQGQGLGKERRGGKMDTASLVALIKAQHPNCLVVATVSAVQPSSTSTFAAPSTSSTSTSTSTSRSSSPSSSSSSSPAIDLLPISGRSNVVISIHSDGNSDDDIDDDGDSNSYSNSDGDGRTDSDSSSEHSSNSRCASSGSGSGNSCSSSCGSWSGGCRCTRCVGNDGIVGCAEKGEDEYFLSAGVDLVWTKPSTAAWSRK